MDDTRFVLGKHWADPPHGFVHIPGLTADECSGLAAILQERLSAYNDAIESAGKVDPVTEDLFIGQAAGLEKFHWFVRAHLESSDGALVTEGASSEVEAAQKARNL